MDLVGVPSPWRASFWASSCCRGSEKALDLDHLKARILGAFLFLSYWANSTGLTDTTASNSAFLTSLYCVIIPFLGWALRAGRARLASTSPPPSCTWPAWSSRSFGGLSGFSAALRRPDHAAVGVLSQPVLYGEVRARSRHDACSRSVVPGGPAFWSFSAGLCVRANARVPPAWGWTRG